MISLLKKRRSIRKFKTKRIEKEKITQLVNAVLRAPSSKNKNPWQFIVVTEKEKIKQLALAKPKGIAFLANAPLAMIMLADPQRSDVWIEDVSICSTITLLMAQNLGLGSCWIQIRNRNYSEDKTAGEFIKELLSIPDQFRVQSIIALGYPNEAFAEKQIPESKIKHVYLNQFGTQWKE